MFHEVSHLDVVSRADWLSDLAVCVLGDVLFSSVSYDSGRESNFSLDCDDLGAESGDSVPEGGLEGAGGKYEPVGVLAGEVHDAGVGGGALELVAQNVGFRDRDRGPGQLFVLKLLLLLQRREVRLGLAVLAHVGALADALALREH